jgi:hypothetical protein
MKIQADLMEAMDIRFAKEGEVSILRKGMERVRFMVFPSMAILSLMSCLQTAQDHASQIVKLKAAKEEADAKQVLVQKEMKEEMERLRTQFTFKVMSIGTTYSV